MAHSRPYLIEQKRGLRLRVRPSDLGHSAETIQQQQLQTEDYLENMCDKNSREAGTQEVDKMINTKYARLFDAVFFVFPLINHIKTMLDIFSGKHSKTECTVRSLGVATCNWNSSTTQGVHHAGVAVELGLLLKNKKLVLIFLSTLFSHYTTNASLAECIRVFLAILKLCKDLHHAGVAAKVALFMVEYVDIITFSLICKLYMAECIWTLVPTATLIMIKFGQGLHHAGVAAGQQAHEEADREGDADEREVPQVDAEPKLLLLVGVLQLCESLYSVWFLQHWIFHRGTCGG